MAFQSMFVYNAARAAQDSAIEKFGRPVTVFKPKEPFKMQGYENLDDFDQFTAMCSVDFHVKRRVFYHFNWFPENEDQITALYFPLATAITADCFVRTATMEQVSPYGDILFRVVKIGDDGKYKTLKRTCFCAAISDQQMYDLLKVKP